MTYVTAGNGEETLVVAEVLVQKALGEGWTVGDRFSGADMDGWTYQRPFELVDWPSRTDERDLPDAHFVVLEDYVTAEDGTGLVHQSPAFGEDDFASCRRNGVAMVNPIDATGHFPDGIPLVGGQFFRHANADLVDDLTKRGLLFRHVPYEHSYPHCWRCHTALLYYAQPSWYVRTTQIKDDLLRENEKTNWFPETIKHGRYGDWLNNNIDWALSRSRYWGTPLPIWRCDEDHQTCVGSLAELSELTGTDQSGLDPHRPFVDDVTFACPTCQGQARRVPEVIDAWFDSGSMPFAQWGYPHVEGSAQMLEQAYPADFICEAIDQTRGWFYTLMAIGTLVFDQSSYRNVLCLGHILAEDGRKMSKHLGNILEPIPLMDEHGADAVRWFMAAGGSPWAARRVGHTTIQETVRKVLLTYWNTVAFQVLYAAPPSGVPATRRRTWPTVRRWTVGRSRRPTGWRSASPRRWSPSTPSGRGPCSRRTSTTCPTGTSADRDDASGPATQRPWRPCTKCLYVVTLLMAPLTPFITERVWRDMFASTSDELPDSVHLASWPRVDGSLVDDALMEQMRLVRRLVELGRAARAEAKVRTRQPLRRALVASAAYARLSEELRREVADELNVGEIEPLSAAGADLVDHSAKGNFRALGKRFAKDTPRVAAAIAAADAGWLAAVLRPTAGRASTWTAYRSRCSADEVILSERPREGWSVVNEQGETVALDLELTPELRRAGLAREVIRMIQEARKTSGFEVSDRIALSWAVLEPTGDGELSAAIDGAPGPDRRRGAGLDDRRGRPGRRPRAGRPAAGTGLHRLPDLTAPDVSSGCRPRPARRAGPRRAPARRRAQGGRRPRRCRRAPRAAG